MLQPSRISYPSADGIHTINAYQWLPQGQLRGVIQLVHGVSEHAGRYQHVAQFLAENGFVVCAEDHLGHGLTVDDGKYGFFAHKNGWQLVVEDVSKLQELVGTQYPQLPYVLLGHSMGSFLVRTYLITHPGRVSGAVLSGTGQESALSVAMGKGVAGALCVLRGPYYVSPLLHRLSLERYNLAFQPNRTPSDWLTRDGDRVDDNLRDPLCTFRPTVSMFRDMMGGLQLIGRRSNLANMDGSTPIYLFSGDCDPVGEMGLGVKRVAGLLRGAGCRDVTLTLYPGGRHEMLNETNRQQVLEQLLDWLNSKNLLVTEL